MTKILHVVDKMNPKEGGVSQAVRTIASSLNEKGIKNVILSLDYKNASFLDKDALVINAIGNENENLWGYSKALGQWLEYNILQYDFVVVHGLWQYPSYITAKIVSKVKKKRNNIQEAGSVPQLFVMPHGMLDPYFQRAPDRKLKAIRNVLYWKLIERHVVNSADALLFTCESERRLAHEPFTPYKPKKEFVVGLGVDTPPSFKSSMTTSFLKKCPEIDKKPYLLFLSRIHEKKGVDLLLLAYSKFLSESKEKQHQDNETPKLVIAGPGIDTAYGKKILDIVHKDPLLNTNVFFPGMLEGDAKWGSFYGCEAFILPSHQENFGIAVVEALACSKPVLISNQVNIWSEIKDSGGGIVDQDSIEGTYTMITKFQNLSPSERENMNNNARLCFETYFAVESATNALLKVFSL
ncbi:glycosyltransferase [Flavobacteriaceae bacterium MHTCC 0001]